MIAECFEAVLDNEWNKFLTLSLNLWIRKHVWLILISYISSLIYLKVRLSSLFWRRIKVSKQLSVIFTDDKRKAVLIRGLETPFWKGKKIAAWYAFEPETRFCRDDKRKVVLKRLYKYLRPTYAKACALRDLCSTAQTAQCSCAVTRPSSRLILAIEFDDKRNYSRKTFRKAFAYAFW